MEQPIIFWDDITIKYDCKGTAFTVSARDYKEPLGVAVVVDEDDDSS